MITDGLEAMDKVPLFATAWKTALVGDDPKLVVIEVGNAPSFKVKACMLASDEDAGDPPKNIEAAFRIASVLIEGGSWSAAAPDATDRDVP